MGEKMAKKCRNILERARANTEKKGEKTKTVDCGAGGIQGKPTRPGKNSSEAQFGKGNKRGSAEAWPRGGTIENSRKTAQGKLRQMNNGKPRGRVTGRLSRVYFELRSRRPRRARCAGGGTSL